MDWKMLGITFITVFLAELGDKTQLATLCFASTGKSPWAIFIGSALALITASLIAVVLGNYLASFLPGRVIRIGSGVLFITVGIGILLMQR